MKRWIMLLFFAWAGWCLPAFADGFIIVDDVYWPGPHRPHPLPPWPRPPHPRPHVFAPLEITYHHVTVKIDGQIATTSVDQEFYNPNPQRLEGTYLFPVPKGAQIDKFTMDIGGKPVAAELLPAEKARRIYEDIVRKSRDPALLEYAGRDVFKVRVFPIEARDHKRITLSYSQVLKSDAGLIGYTYPLNTEKYSARPIKSVSLKIELQNKRPLKTIYSPSHSVEITRSGPNRAAIGFESSNVQPDTDFVLYYATEKEDLAVNLLTHQSPGEDGYFLLLASPGVEATGTKIVAKDVAFVLDTSGSMAGAKLEQAKKALQFCIENLNEIDRFELIRFSTEVEPLFDRFVAATRTNRARAEEFVEGLKPMGSTAIDEALRKGLSLRRDTGDRPFVLVFLTDGRPTIGVTGEDDIVANVKRANMAAVRVFCFGIGTDVNTHLLDRIAEDTRAFSQYVLPEEDLELKVSSFFSRIKDPVLANPALAFTGGIRVSKLYPSALPDLFKGEQLIVVGRYTGGGAAAAVIEGQVNGETRRFAQDVDFSGDRSDSDFIPRLWATRRVGYLLDEIRLRGENSETREEVTELARKYGIVTPYTAYLIVEDETRRNVPVEVQSLPQFGADMPARAAAKDTWNDFKEKRMGTEALSGSRYRMVLQGASAPAAAAADGAVEANRALGLAPGVPATVASEHSKVRLAQYAQQTRFVAGKNFFETEKGWVDASVQKYVKAPRVRVQFGSSDYFALVRTHPEASPWLALGQTVQFVLNESVYEIHE